MPRVAVCWLHGMPGDFAGSHPSHRGEYDTDLLDPVRKTALFSLLILKGLDGTRQFALLV